MESYKFAAALLSFLSRMLALAPIDTRRLGDSQGSVVAVVPSGELTNSRPIVLLIRSAARYGAVEIVLNIVASLSAILIHDYPCRLVLQIVRRGE